MGVGAEAVIRDEGAEHEQRGDLPGDTGHHEIVAELLVAGRVRGGCDAAARTLQDEREQVAQDEDPGVVFCP